MGTETNGIPVSMQTASSDVLDSFSILWFIAMSCASKVIHVPTMKFSCINNLFY